MILKKRRCKSCYAVSRQGCAEEISKRRSQFITTAYIHHGPALNQFFCFRYKVEISGGLGPTAGKVFRIGLMGQNATPEKVDLVLKVLKEGLESAGHKPKL